MNPIEPGSPSEKPVVDPSGAQPPTTEQERQDEALAEHLEDYLDSLGSGAAPPSPAPTDPELRQLCPVVQSLHELAQYLATPSPGDADTPNLTHTQQVWNEELERIAERFQRAWQETEAGQAPPQIEAFLGEATGSAREMLRQKLETLQREYQSSGQTGSPPLGGTEGAGQRIGKYEIRQPLGQGGQAAAYLAFDPDLKRHVVLKLYRQAVTAAQQDTVLREGQALARVRSRYVAQCYGVERHDGVPYLVMEYIPGQNLAQRHRSRPLNVTAALEVSAQLAEGLAAVHACGLLHRDIKPANVIMGDDDVPRLVDFGLAATLASDALHGLSGTLAYMAPEQARGQVERIDPRTDLYGLGAVLYELLTGRPVHQGANYQELLAAAKVGDVLPPRQLKPKLPAAVNDLCLKCLACDPALRFGSAVELRDALRRLQMRGWRQYSWLLAAASLVVLLGGAYLLFRPGTAQLQEPPQVVLQRHPDDGRLLRRHFDVKAELLGGVPDPSGVNLLTEGDKVRIRISVAKDCYVGVSFVDDQGNVTLLFPNQFDKDHLVRKGQPRLIPPEDAKYAITATPSPGKEFIHVFATTKYFEPIGGQRAGPYDLFATPKERTSFHEMLRGLGIIPDERGLKVVPDEERGPEATRVSETIVPFRVRARKGP